MPRRVSAISVAYASEAEIATALESTRVSADRAGVDLEMIVVDNASGDASADVVETTFPRAQIIRNALNVGFGPANNQAFEVATGDAWLLINPDARLEPAALGEMLSFLDAHPQVAAVAPMIAGGGAHAHSFERGAAESAGMLPGMAAAAGHFLLINRLLPGDRGGAWRGFQLTRKPEAGPRRVDWASAAVLLLRPAAIREVGGFDRTIFMYGEDVELGERLGRAGWEIWLIPTARAWHQIATSQSGVSTLWIDSLHNAVARRSRRVRLVLFDTMVGSSLLLRAVASRGGETSARMHRRRMRASGKRAICLAAHALRRGVVAASDGRIHGRCTPP